MLIYLYFFKPYRQLSKGKIIAIYKSGNNRDLKKSTQLINVEIKNGALLLVFQSLWVLFMKLSNVLLEPTLLPRDGEAYLMTEVRHAAVF